MLDNIQLPLQFSAERRKRAGNIAETAAKLCDALHLPDDILVRKAGELSVGQQQRVAVARALIGKPPLIVADEPTSALDADAQEAFLDLLLGQAKTDGISVLMVSHDARLSDRFDRSVHLSDIIAKAEVTA